MSTSATVDTNEGWTFTDDTTVSEFPTTTEQNNDWGPVIHATTTDSWNVPMALSPPLSAVEQP